MTDDLFSLLISFDGVEQSRKYHPEGDALFHSLQVFDLARRASSDRGIWAAAHESAVFTDIASGHTSYTSARTSRRGSKLRTGPKPRCDSFPSSSASRFRISSPAIVKKGMTLPGTRARVVAIDENGVTLEDRGPSGQGAPTEVRLR